MATIIIDDSDDNDDVGIVVRGNGSSIHLGKGSSRTVVLSGPGAVYIEGNASLNDLKKGEKR